MIDTVLFDLDGTLLPMDQEEFVKLYLGLLARYMEEYEYEPKRLMETMGAGIRAMVTNDGSRTNEEAFWQVFRDAYGERTEGAREVLEQFYASEFIKARVTCGLAPESAELIRWLKEQGVRVVLATNPLFPRTATMQRIRWAGLDPADFELVTTYEAERFCKPNPDYYREILTRLQLDPARCVMVGNDAVEDVAAEQAGLEVFLLTDCLLNGDRVDLSSRPSGNFARLKAFLEERL